MVGCTGAVRGCMHERRQDARFEAGREETTEIVSPDVRTEITASARKDPLRLMSVSTPKPATSRADRRRRRYPRYATDFRVTVSHLLGDKYLKLEGHCRDLSEAGIGILLASELDGGEVTGLSFLLPGSAIAWEVRAVVRYRRLYQYGFEFLSLTGAQQEALKNYVENLKPMD